MLPHGVRSRRKMPSRKSIISDELYFFLVEPLGFSCVGFMWVINGKTVISFLIIKYMEVLLAWQPVVFPLFCGALFHYTIFSRFWKRFFVLLEGLQ